MTKKYFPNNWNRLVKVPDSAFESFDYESFMDWINFDFLTLLSNLGQMAFLKEKNQDVELQPKQKSELEVKEALLVSTTLTKWNWLLLLYFFVIFWL